MMKTVVIAGCLVVGTVALLWGIGPKVRADRGTTGSPSTAVVAKNTAATTIPAPSTDADEDGDATPADSHDAAQPRVKRLPHAAATEDGLSVYFSPDGRCTDAIIRAIKNARVSVDVQAAQFESKSIAKALSAAHKRGVSVRVIVDRRKNADKDSKTDNLVDRDVPTYYDDAHNTAHNKLILIDRRVIITGSFNFTKEAEEDNAENLLMVEDKPQLVAAYEQNFSTHLAHSKPYEK